MKRLENHDIPSGYNCFPKENHVIIIYYEKVYDFFKKQYIKE